MRNTVYRKDCMCRCHRDTGVLHVVACCFDPDSGASDEERDVAYFQHKLWGGVGKNCEDVQPEPDLNKAGQD